MKRTVLKLGSLSVLAAATWFFYLGSPAEAAVLSCWEQAYNKWMSCDGAYLNTKYLYIGGASYCTNSATTICSSTANTFCTTQATSACANDPNPQQCFNSTYNNCYLQQYQDCHLPTALECLQVLQTNYNNRAEAYQRCLGIEGNYNNCVEELEFSCIDAQNRASACNTVYSESDDGDVQALCRATSGIDQCQ